MSQEIAEAFIAELTSTIQNYESKRDASPRFGSILEVSSHMVEALSQLNTTLATSDTSQSTA